MDFNIKENLITEDFCKRPTLEVAPELLGCFIHHRLDDGTVLSGKIVEVEAYTQDDPSCHAFRGRTPRSETLFGRPAKAYVYFIYGMYHCLNIVTEPDGRAGAVLVRALEPVPPLTHTHGPGRLCKSLKIDKSHNEVDLTTFESPLWLTIGESVSSKSIVTTTRIGIKLAADYPWRFYIAGNSHVSVK